MVVGAVLTTVRVVPRGAIVFQALLLGLFLSAAGSMAEEACAPNPAVSSPTPDIPFIYGSIWVPAIPGAGNNTGVIEHQKAAGTTHIEAYVSWRLVEQERGQWDFSEWRRCCGLARERGLKMCAFPWIQYAPEWFKATDDYVPLQEVGTGKTADVLSPWAPGTRKAIGRFYRALSKHCGDEVDIILYGAPTSDYGEIGLLIGAPHFCDPANHLYPFFPQSSDAWHPGLWCGDPYARADFRKWALKRYGSLANLNKAWGTAFGDASEIAFPDRERRRQQRRHWLDFMYWYHESQVDLAEEGIRIVRKYFPRILLEAGLGFGDDNPLCALDRTAVCRRLAQYKPFGIRSTHAAVNRGDWNQAYWFYKRMAPVAHRYGAAFGTEPPGGDLSVLELHQQIFEDASAGVDYVYSYFQNFMLLPDTVDRFRAALRPGERPCVDIGILYPTAQLLLDMETTPEWQIPFCSVARDCLDYDVVDENMIAWGMLDDYRVLVQTSGGMLETQSLQAIDRWIRAGGLLVARGDRPLRTVEEDASLPQQWYSSSPTEYPDGTKSYAVDRGQVVLLEGPRRLNDLIGQVVGALLRYADACLGRRPLRGFDGAADGIWTTEFPSGKLTYDAETRVTRFTPAGRE